MNTQRRMWFKIWGVLLVVFALGCITGASLIGIRGRSVAAPQPLSMKDSESYFDTLQRELNLTADQASGMQAILDETRNDYKAVCADVRPRYDTLRARARSRMRALLTPQQQERFDAIITQEDCKCPDPQK